MPLAEVRVVATPSQLQVREGAEARFVCHFEGDARSRLVWSRLPQVTIVHVYHIFIIPQKTLHGFVVLF